MRVFIRGAGKTMVTPVSSGTLSLPVRGNCFVSGHLGHLVTLRGPLLKWQVSEACGGPILCLGRKSELLSW